MGRSHYVEVEIHPEELDGWHHLDDCPEIKREQEEWEKAVESLHQQAHPDEPLTSEKCRQEPCRTLHDPHRNEGKAA